MLLRIDLVVWKMLYGSDVEKTEIKIPIYPRSRLVVTGPSGAYTIGRARREEHATVAAGRGFASSSWFRSVGRRYIR